MSTVYSPGQGFPAISQTIQVPSWANSKCDWHVAIKLIQIRRGYVSKKWRERTNINGLINSLRRNKKGEMCEVNLGS